MHKSAVLMLLLCPHVLRPRLGLLLMQRSLSFARLGVQRWVSSNCVLSRIKRHHRVTSQSPSPGSYSRM